MVSPSDSSPTSAQAIAQRVQRILQAQFAGCRVRAIAQPATHTLQIRIEGEALPTAMEVTADLWGGLGEQAHLFQRVQLAASYPGASRLSWQETIVLTPEGGDRLPPSAQPTPFSHPGHDHGRRYDEAEDGAKDGTEESLTEAPLGEALGSAMLFSEKHATEDEALHSLNSISSDVYPHRAAPLGRSHPRRSNDLGWQAVAWLQRFNPFAAILVLILSLHILFGAQHYTPTGFINARDPLMMFLHNVNLIFHEAGHVILGIFGRFIGLLGGSLMQVGVPLWLSIYFVITKQRFAAAIALWWTGQNLLDVSLYIKDAQERDLPLLGGEGVMHDWHFILLDLHLLLKDDLIAGIVYSLGLLICMGAIALGFYFAYQPHSSSNYQIR